MGCYFGPLCYGNELGVSDWLDFQCLPPGAPVACCMEEVFMCKVVPCVVGIWCSYPLAHLLSFTKTPSIYGNNTRPHFQIPLVRRHLPQLEKL